MIRPAAESMDGPAGPAGLSAGSPRTLSMPSYPIAPE